MKKRMNKAQRAKRWEQGSRQLREPVESLYLPTSRWGAGNRINHGTKGGVRNPDW